jgi:hypothetical protein
MSTNDDDRNSLEARARRRVGLKTGFYTHALVFVLVNGGLYALNSALGGMRWSNFPLWGWSLGLAIHGIVVLARLHGGGLHRRMVDAEVERLRRRQG